METKKVITWNDVKRSTEAWDWKKSFNNCVLTPEKLNAFLVQKIKELEDKK